jgi:hypothetical protein
MKLMLISRHTCIWVALRMTATRGSGAGKIQQISHFGTDMRCTHLENAKSKTLPARNNSSPEEILFASPIPDYISLLM